MFAIAWVEFDGVAVNSGVIGARVGRAIAKHVLAEGMPREWTGLDAQDGDQLTAAGIEPGTDEWDEAERAAQVAYAEWLNDHARTQGRLGEP